MHLPEPQVSVQTQPRHVPHPYAVADGDDGNRTPGLDDRVARQSTQMALDAEESEKIGTEAVTDETSDDGTRQIKVCSSALICRDKSGGATA